MANIIELKNKKTGVKQYPITKSQAVYGPDGNAVSQRLETDKNDIETLKERVSGFTRLSEGSVTTTGDAELVDTRDTWYGTTETSAGNAVRNQAENLILTQSGKPTGNALKGNKVWIKPSQDDIEIPDMDDFNKTVDNLNNINKEVGIIKIGNPTLGRLDTAEDIDEPVSSTAKAVLDIFTITETVLITPNPKALSGEYGVAINNISSFPTTFILYSEKNNVLTKIKNIGQDGIVIKDTDAKYRIEFYITPYTNNTDPKFKDIIFNDKIFDQIFINVKPKESILNRVDRIQENMSINPVVLDLSISDYQQGFFNKDNGNSSKSSNFFRSTNPISFSNYQYINIKNNSTKEFWVCQFSEIPNFTNNADNSLIFIRSYSEDINKTCTFAPEMGYYYYIIVHVPFNDISDDIIPTISFYSDISNQFNIINNTLKDIKNNAIITPYEENENKLINAINKDVNNNKIIIVLSTDNHYNDADAKDCNQVRFATAISKIAKKINADFIINLGDIIEGYNDSLTVSNYNYQYINYKRLSEMINALYTSRIPVIYAAGHHEMYPIADIFAANGDRTENRGFQMSDVYRLVFGEQDNFPSQTGFRGSLNSVCVNDDPFNSLSFYFDYAKENTTIRFVIIDGCDYGNRGYSTNTIQFVVNALTDAKTNDIPVIICSHIPPISAGVIKENATAAKNESQFNDAIDAVGANIIAYFYGHIHHDNIITELKPYPLIGFNCQKLYRQWSVAPNIYGNPSCPARTIGTYSEYSFDVILIDINTYNIDCYRFGAGDTGTYPTRSIIKT